MPTKPVSDIIVRELQPDIKSLLEGWSIHMDEVVNYGSTILENIGNLEKLGGDEEAPLIMTLRNSLELMDAVSILFSKSSIDPCKPLIRTILESLFTVCYITEKNSMSRSRDYLVCHYYKKLAIYKKLDTNTQQGKQWKAEILSDRLMGKMKTPLVKNLPKYVENIENILKKPVYKISVTEYKRIKKKKSKPTWHEFFKGPKNKYDLAKQLNLLGVYDILYRQFSEDVHGMDIIDKKIGRAPSGWALITQIRAPFAAQTLCSISISIMIDMYKNLIQHYIPYRGKEFALWYMYEIRDFQHELSIKTLLEVK